MGFLQSALVSFTLLVTALSSPNPFVLRNACNADNCLRAIIASSHSPYPSSASKDCQSFFAKTVTPCPTTTTTTVFATKTEPAPTTTLLVTTSPITSTSTSVNVIPFTITSTIVETTTVQTIDLTATSNTLISETLSTTTTQTVILPTTATVVAKRAITAPLRIPFVAVNTVASDELVERGVSSQCPSTQSPTGVPTYASACSGIVRYSSACSCIGVTQTTFTAPRSTITSTTTSTIHVTLSQSIITSTLSKPTIASTVVQSSQENDASTTLFVPQTLQTTDFTTYVTSTSTISVVATVTDSIPAATQSCNFQILVVGGSQDGQYIQNTGQDGFAIFSSPGTVYKLDGTGQVVNTADGNQIWDVDYNTYSFIDINSEAEIGSSSYATISCSVATADQSFTCNSSGGLNTFYTTNDQFSDYPRIASAGNLPSGASVLNLKAVLQC